MNDHENGSGGVHWSFWAIGVVTLLFNLAGIANFLVQMNADIVAAMPDAYRAIIESRPVWATAAFAVAVFGGGIGCLLLLLRKPIAYYLFIASLIGAVGAQLPILGVAEPPVDALIGGVIQLAVTVFLIWYTSWVGRRGWIGQ